MKTLKRYWFTLARSPKPTALNIGCGVTAHDRDDAFALLREKVFGGAEPKVLAIKEDVDLSTLDRNHVVPNMGSPLIRGIWFPLGYGDA
jgi:hypothetical protein